MKVLLDMNLPLEWEEFLIAAGIDARHWAGIGDPRAADSTIMRFARESGFVVITQDLDFGTLLALTHAAGPSVIQLRVQDTYPEQIGSQLLATLRLLSPQLERGALVTVVANRTRVRVLPLR